MATVMAATAPAAFADDYKIQHGDTLTAIASRFGTDVVTLKRLNPTLRNTNVIRDGKVLTVPGTKGSDPSTATVAARRDIAFPPPIEAAQHVVAKGENLSVIARQYSTTVSALVEANHVLRPNRLAVGTTLTVSNAPAYQNLPHRLLERNERLVLMGYFDRYAAEAGIDPSLIKALAFVESGWQPGVLSVDGAIGIGQLMPATAAEVAAGLGDPSLDPWDPVANIRMSAHYLRELMDRFHGNTRSAVAAYYQGHGSVKRRGPSHDGAAYARAVLSQQRYFRAG